MINTGPLPASWNNFTALYHLALYDNKLSGT